MIFWAMLLLRLHFFLYFYMTPSECFLKLRLVYSNELFFNWGRRLSVPNWLYTKKNTTFNRLIGNLLPFFSLFNYTYWPQISENWHLNIFLLPIKKFLFSIGFHLLHGLVVSSLVIILLLLLFLTTFEAHLLIEYGQSENGEPQWYKQHEYQENAICCKFTIAFCLVSSPNNFVPSHNNIETRYTWGLIQLVQVVVELQLRQPTIWVEHNTQIPPTST